MTMLMNKARQNMQQPPAGPGVVGANQSKAPGIPPAGNMPNVPGMPPPNPVSQNNPVSNSFESGMIAKY